jgi:hypothetical protein
MKKVEFTYDWYRELLTEIVDAEFRDRSFADKITKGDVILRHDVDWAPRKAVELARIESEYGLTSTYFFLITSPFYNIHEASVREAIKKIQEMGHRIGLHFSTHQYWESNPGRGTVSEKVSSELSALSSVIPEVDPHVSFHNPPEWIFRESWPDFVSTYEARFFENIEYLADSNQRWRSNQPFGESFPEKLQILTHPVLWGEQDGFATDRLREERDYHFHRITRHLEKTDRTWKGVWGVEES